MTDRSDSNRDRGTVDRPASGRQSLGGAGRKLATSMPKYIGARYSCASRLGTNRRPSRVSRWCRIWPQDRCCLEGTLCKLGKKGVGNGRVAYDEAAVVVAMGIVGQRGRLLLAMGILSALSRTDAQECFSAKETHEEGGGLEGGGPVADGGVVAGGSPGRRDCAGTAPKGLRSVGEQKHAQAGAEGQESGGRGR